MTVHSNVKEIDKSFHSIQLYNPYELFTISAIENDLTFRLSSKYEYQIDENNIIHLSRKYLDYADRFLYRINLIRPLPKFELSWQDIPQSLQGCLIKLDPKTLNEVLTNAVRNILESVDPVYFHTNGIYGKAKWRITD